MLLEELESVEVPGGLLAAGDEQRARGKGGGGVEMALLDGGLGALEVDLDECSVGVCGIFRGRLSIDLDEVGLATRVLGRGL